MAISPSPLNDNDFRNLLTHEATLESLVYALEQPLNWDAAYEAYLKSHRKMGCYGQPSPKDIWVNSAQRKHDRKVRAAQQKLNEVRAERIAAAMEELGDDFHHFSIRYSGEHGFGTPNVYVYRKDRTSPTGCWLVTSAKDCPEVRAAVGAGRNEYEGPRCGEMAGTIPQ